MKEGTINVVVTTEQHFDRTPDARVSTAGCFSYPFWTRFLAEFDSVRILAWTCKVLAAPAGFPTRQRSRRHLCRSARLSGTGKILAAVGERRTAAAKSVQNSDAVILRIPGRTGTCVESHPRKMRRPYAVEVVGDPYNVFALGVVRHPLRPTVQNNSFACKSATEMRSQMVCDSDETSTLRPKRILIGA
jgi:phosphatidylinositol alpha-1,6-mannosyltransferase